MSLTCVSAYFSIKSKQNHDIYKDWFKNTLAINCPYVFFTNDVDFIKGFRKDLPTFYIECKIDDFYTYKYKDKILTHEIHCPSVELNMIWNEKIFMIKKAKDINPFNSSWFYWIDAGICVYRNSPPPIRPFPEMGKLRLIPKDKFIYSQSEPYNEGLVDIANYYHHVSGTYLLHKNIIDSFTELYEEYLEKLMGLTNIWTDQVILTHIYKDKPEMFYKLCDGYGEICHYLY